MGFVDDDAWLYNMSLRCVIRIQRKSMNNVYVCVCVWLSMRWFHSKPAEICEQSGFIGRKEKNLINHIWKTFLIIQIYTAKNSLPPIYSSLDDRRAEWHLVRVKWVQWYYNGVIVLVWRSSHVILTWAISAAPQKNGTRKETLGITETNNEAKKKLFFHMIMRGLKHKYIKRIISMSRLFDLAHYNNKICILPFYWHLIRYVTRLMNYINIIITHRGCIEYDALRWAYVHVRVRVCEMGSSKRSLTFSCSLGGI